MAVGSPGRRYQNVVAISEEEEEERRKRKEEEDESKREGGRLKVSRIVVEMEKRE